MDSKLSSSPQTTKTLEQTYCYSSGSSSSASSAYAFSSSASCSPYQFSDVGVSTGTYVFGADDSESRGGSTNAGSGGVPGSGDGGGFGSAEKEFGGGFVGGENSSGVVGGEGGGTGSFVVGSSEFSMSSDQRPIAKVSIDDDDDDYALGGSKDGVLGARESGEESVGGDKILEIVGDKSSPEEVSIKNENFGELAKENGVSDAKSDGFGAKVDEKVVVEQESEDFDGREFGVASEVAEDGKTVDGVREEENSVILEPTDDKLVDSDGANFTAGDSVVEAVQVDASASGAAIVGDAEGIEIRGLGVPVDGVVKLDNEFDTLRRDSEELVSAKSVPVDSESDANVVVESGDGGPAEQETVITGSDELDSNNIPGREDGVEPDSLTKQIEIGADGVGVLSVGRDEAENSLVNTVSDLEPHESAREAKPIDNGEDSVEAKVDELEAGIADKSNTPESLEPNSTLSREIVLENEDEEKRVPDEDDDVRGSDTDEETEDVIYGSSAKQFLEELERASGADSSRDNSQRIDGQIVTDSDEEVDTDEEEGGGKELFDSAALAALLKAATGASPDGGNVTISTSDGPRLFSVERPAGLGSSLPKIVSRPNHSNIFASINPTVGGDTENNLSEEEKKRLDKFQQLRVKYLRLVNRLGVSIDDTISRQVLYRLSLVSGRVTSREYSTETAKETALRLEEERKDDLDFSFNILVLGKTGVGKSATINSIFGEEKIPIYAFGPSTTAVKEIVGVVDGVKIRVFDTPGLKSAAMEQSFNRRILSSVQKVTKKCPPDIVLYVDRLDTQSRDRNDLPLLRSITSALGPSIWRSGIVTLTHAASSPPDGPTGSPLNYELFVAQRSQIVQQTIGQAVGDLRVMSPSLMNPISLVENHPSCRKNRDGQKVLPNGQTWRSQLLLLCYSMKILSEASSLSKPQESFDQRKLFGFRTRSPPLPYLLSWLLQSRTHPKLSAEQGGENGDSDIDLDDLSDSDGEEEDEYDQLPPFKPLRRSQIAKLTREQKKAYLEEYDYRVKLLQKKQWREELKRMKEMKKGKVSTTEEYGYPGEDDLENGAPAAVPVALPDMVLPPSFDGDNPAYRYRFLEPTSQFLARPVLDTHGWDHDCGYDGVNIEHGLAIANRFPGAVAVQITKDKKEFNLHLDSSIAAKHGESGSTMAGFDIQNIGKQLAYIVRGETKFKSFRKNKTAAGASVTFLGENVSTGFKIEDQIGLGKRVVLVGSTGIVKSQSDSAYGANLEVRLRDSDFPIGQDQTSLGLSLVKWRGDLALGANLQSQFSIGRNFKMAVRGGLNNKMSGQISVRTSSSEQLQIALVAALPIVRSICKILWPGAATENYSLY